VAGHVETTDFVAESVDFVLLVLLLKIDKCHLSLEACAFALQKLMLESLLLKLKGVSEG